MGKGTGGTERIALVFSAVTEVMSTKRKVYEGSQLRVIPTQSGEPTSLTLFERTRWESGAFHEDRTEH